VKLRSGSVAQLVEQRPFKALVPGSSPGRPIVATSLRGAGTRPAGPRLQLKQIAQRISRPIQSKHQQAGCGGCFPIAFRIVADMEDLVRIEMHYL
jgi:hypothetical protein